MASGRWSWLLYKGGKLSLGKSSHQPLLHHFRMVSIPSMLASSQDVTLPYFPELYDADFLDILLPSTQKSTTAPAASAPNSFIDALKAASHHTYTTNFAKAYNSTESPVLDAFHKLTPYASSREIRDVLAKAWAEDPQLTLRIIWNSRSIHDGKGEKELFYRAFGWLYRNHPRTAIHNLPALIARSEQNEGASHGYWKDLLNILALVALDDIGTLNAREPLNFLHNFQTEQDAAWMKNMYRTELNKLGSTATPSDRKACSISITPLVQRAAKERRVQKDAQLHGLLLRKLEEATFRALYVAVARLFTEQIMKDLAVLKESEAISDVKERKTHLRQLTFVSKWAPNPRGSHDRVTNISSAIALLLHYHGAMTGLSLPVDHSSATLSLRDTHIIRSFYTRWNIRPLRDAVVIPEVLMAAGKWSQIPYSRVPSICMKNNTERFFVHDTDRFTKYMEDVESGKKTISGATLMPHEILQLIMREYKNLSSPSRAKSGSATALADIRRKLVGQKIQVLEAQWQTMIRRLRESGALDNALAVCDVSGSMGSVYHSLSGKGRIQPIVPALALSLVTAQLAKPPFANGFITFSAMPQFVVLEPQRSLGEAVIKMVESDWSMNTNFDSVFLDLLLPIAVENKVLQEDMVKRLFVFSDMQFDEARDGQGYYHMEQEPIQKSTEWETNHDVIERAFKQAGYEMPQIVYWNLGDTFMTTPVTAEKKGVALLNSFSPAMMKVFMGEEDESMLEGEDNWEDIGDREEKQADDFTPLNVMKKALGKKSYEGLIVVD